MNKQYQDGLANDPRSDESISKDYLHPAGSISIHWIEKPIEQWKKYTPREQDGSLSCCGQGSAKAVETINGIVMSAHPPYRSRSNYPAGGMYLQDIGKVWKDIGSTAEGLDASQFESEDVMNRDIIVPTPTKMAGYFFPKYNSIDDIAEAIELHKHCILIFHSNRKEWNSYPIYNGEEIDFGHCICAVDYFLKDGVKVLLIEDSTGHFNSLDGNGQRLFSEDYISKRCAGAIYFIKDIADIPYKFTKTLRFGSEGFDVKKLQMALNSLGMIIKVDGKFGRMTQEGVKSFQKRNGLKDDGVVGRLTNEKLNAL